MEFEKLRDIIVEVLQIDPEKVTTETAFEDLDADSLDLVEVMMGVEDMFHIEEIDEEKLQFMKTVGDVVNYISDRI